MKPISFGFDRSFAATPDFATARSSRLDALATRLEIGGDGHSAFGNLK